MTDFTRIHASNDTAQEYENDACIHDKLEYFARISPNAIALKSNTSSFSYNELNNLSNALSHELTNNGVMVEDFILVCLERSFELIISVYGILKAGAVYTPIMTTYPAERIKYIIQDSSPRYIITDKTNASLFTDLGYSSVVLVIDDFLEKPIKDISTPIINVQPNNLAYMIYTSGTTGNPKGVMVEHHSIVNHISWLQKQYPIDSSDLILFKTSITFDVSMIELYWWSFVGSSLFVLNPGEEKDPKKMLTQISKHKVSVIQFVPSMLNIFVSYLQTVQDAEPLQNLKYVLCCGEALSVSSSNAMYSELAKYKASAIVVNLYGPAEATVNVTYFTCKPQYTKPIPIGKPIDNTRIYIINEKNEILPLNEKGELIICGENLARGYFKRDVLNKEKFITMDIFGKTERAYKTGDIAFFNDQDEIEFIGRNDNQIKLRGYRIELGEIESCIRSCEGIIDCSVIVENQNDANALLIAFLVVHRNSTNVNYENIKGYLDKQLPGYMIPSRFVVVDQIPLTHNGKLDKHKLMELLNKNDDTPESVISSDLTEQIIYKIWCELLNKSALDVDSNFFDLGGNSLLMIKMSILLNKELNIDIDIIDLFSYPSISELSQYISTLLKVI